MVYLPNIPQPNDKPSKSQSQILGNFGELNTQFGTEHVALNAASGNGQHLAITLPRNPSVANPTGTNWLLEQGFASNKATLQIRSTGPNYSHIPLRHVVNKNGISAGAGTHTIVDFTTIPGMAALSNAAGTLFMFDVNQKTRSLFSTFVYDGATIFIPSGPSGNSFPSGQLPSGDKWTGFTSVGTVLKFTTAAGSPGTDAILIITESRYV